MRLSNQYRILFWRQAALTDDQILGVYKRYKYLNDPKEELAQFKEIQETLSAYTTKIDLLAEWVVKSLALRSGRYPEDMARFIGAYQFYSKIYAATEDPAVRLQKIQKFRNAVERFNEETDLTTNPKNILDFTLHDLEKLESYYTGKIEDPRVNQLGSKLPEGSQIFYNDGNYQIVEVTSASAACDLGRGTKWCTSDKEVADTYLADSPLYVIYIRGKKTAQLYIDKAGKEIQLMDLRDRDIVPDQELRLALIKTGFLGKILDLINNPYYGELKRDKNFKRWMGNERVPEIEPFILENSGLSVAYARFNLHGPFPDAESIIADSPKDACYYARYVLKDRFPLAELKILQSESLFLYVRILAGSPQSLVVALPDEFQSPTDPLKNFLRDYPDVQALDEFRWYLFPIIWKYRGETYRTNKHSERRPDGRLVVTYRNLFTGAWIEVDSEGKVFRVSLEEGAEVS